MFGLFKIPQKVRFSALSSLSRVAIKEWGERKRPHSAECSFHFVPEYDGFNEW